jgi:Fic family protein
MLTLKRLSRTNLDIPGGTSWYLADLSEFKGKQALFTHQAPQRLKALRESALIESAVSSNRIEGVTLDKDRTKAVLQGAKPLFRDRDEEEVRGYREALSLLHGITKASAINESRILKLHRMVRGKIWDAGKYKDKDGDIIETYSDGRSRVRFKTVSAKATPKAMKELIESWIDCNKDRSIHPLIAMAAFNLDFLCIHPFRDGNGRVSRLILLAQCYELGFEVGRYISIERLIEQNKVRYYETLEDCSQGWHEGKNNPWPYINFILNMLKQAYLEFESRVGNLDVPRGSKTEMVLAAIARMQNEFTLVQLEQACTGVSRDMIRKVLADQKEKSVASIGRGPAALWRKLG